MNPFPDDELFSAYLDGEATAEEREAVERALDSDPRARQIMDDLQSVKSSFDVLPQYRLGDAFSDGVIAGQNGQATFDPADIELSERPSKWRSRLRIAAAAVTALAPALAIIFLWPPPSEQARLDGEDSNRAVALKEDAPAPTKRLETNPQDPQALARRQSGFFESGKDLDGETSNRDKLALKESEGREKKNVDPPVDRLALKQFSMQRTAVPKSKQSKLAKNESRIAPSGAAPDKGGVKGSNGRGANAPAPLLVVRVDVTEHAWRSGEIHRLLAARQIRLAMPPPGQTSNDKAAEKPANGAAGNLDESKRERHAGEAPSAPEKVAAAPQILAPQSAAPLSGVKLVRVVAAPQQVEQVMGDLSRRTQFRRSVLNLSVTPDPRDRDNDRWLQYDSKTREKAEQRPEPHTSPSFGGSAPARGKSEPGRGSRKYSRRATTEQDGKTNKAIEKKRSDNSPRPLPVDEENQNSWHMPVAPAKQPAGGAAPGLASTLRAPPPPGGPAADPEKQQPIQALFVFQIRSATQTPPAAAAERAPR